MARPVRDEPGHRRNVAAHQVTRTSTNSATWNTADGTTAWTSAGGDYTATPAAVTAVNNAVNPIQRFYVDKLVQGWVDGTIANQGILFKQQVESTTNTQTFGGGNNATTYQRPLLSIEYAARLGTDPSMTFVSKQLSDRMSVQGNVANQNLVVQATDMTIPGVGVDLGLTRTWNSKGFATSSNTIDFGNSSRWVLSLGKSVRIEKPFTGDGHPVLYGPDGRVDSLLSDGAGGFVSTPGLNAKLTKPLSTRYELTYNKSGQKSRSPTVPAPVPSTGSPRSRTATATPSASRTPRPLGQTSSTPEAAPSCSLTTPPAPSWLAS